MSTLIRPGFLRAGSQRPGSTIRLQLAIGPAGLQDELDRRRTDALAERRRVGREGAQSRYLRDARDQRLHDLLLLAIALVPVGFRRLNEIMLRDRRETPEMTSSRSISGTPLQHLLDLLGHSAPCTGSSSLPARRRARRWCRDPRPATAPTSGSPNSMKPSPATHQRRPARTRTRARSASREQPPVAVGEPVQAALDAACRTSCAWPRAAAASSTSSATASARRSPRPAPRRPASRRTR